MTCMAWASLAAFGGVFATLIVVVAVILVADGEPEAGGDRVGPRWPKDKTR